VTLFDTHAHLGAPELWVEAKDILDRGRAGGLVGVIAVGSGYGLERNAYAVALAGDHDDVWATVGVHPHEAELWDERAARALNGWLEHPRVVAVGECGLDYWYENSPRDAQRACLREQIRLAHEVQLPLVLHVRASRNSRDAFDDMIRIFDEENADRAGGVMHCFTGDAPFAADCLRRSFDISFSGILTFKNAGELREVAQGLPLDRLLVETDSPLLAPQPLRGKRNEPAYVAHVVDCLAGIRGKSSENVAARTAERARHTFRLDA
jgi:TatD DNase family protein